MPKAQRDPFGLGLTIPTPRPIEPPPHAPEPVKPAAEFKVEVPEIQLPKFDFGEPELPESSSHTVSPNLPEEDVLFEEPSLEAEPVAAQVKVDLSEPEPTLAGAEDDPLSESIDVSHDESPASAAPATESELDFSSLNPEDAIRPAPVPAHVSSEPEISFDTDLDAPIVARPPTPAPVVVPAPAPVAAQAQTRPELRSAPKPATTEAPIAALAEVGIEARLREALSMASREMIERIAWEVVPQLAETIIRQELDRLVKERQGK